MVNLSHHLGHDQSNIPEPSSPVHLDQGVGVGDIPSSASAQRGSTKPVQASGQFSGLQPFSESERQTRRVEDPAGYQIAMPIPASLHTKDCGLATRMERIATYVANASRLMSEHPQPGLKIFAAPEYYFDQPVPPGPSPLRHGEGDVRQLTEVQYHEIDSAMRQLSARYPDVVIKVPIAWHKPAARPTTEGQYLASKGASAPDHPLHDHYVNQWANKDKSAYANSSSTRLGKAQQANDIGLQRFGERYRHDFPEIAPSTTHLARNTVLTYFDGRRISKYNKIMGMQEVRGSNEGEAMQFFSGMDYGGKHLLPTGDMATQEICRDHAVNTARAAGVLHFVHSDGARPRNATGKYRDTSVVVHSNTFKKTGDIFNLVDLQKVEIVQDAEGKVLAPVQPEVTTDGVELYNINPSKMEKR